MIYEAVSQENELERTKKWISLQTPWIRKPFFNDVLLLSLKVTGINEEQLLVTVLPGLPTTAEIFIVPEKKPRDGGMDEKWAHLDQVQPSNYLNGSSTDVRSSVVFYDI